MTQPLAAADPLFDERYLAMSSRDARFDGQFIAGVHSTGIYCRPSCPAVTPKRSNVSFYLTAAAAHEAGLRACKRCLPDAVPGSPQWDIRDDLSAHAMRLIADGVVERSGVPGLAAQLGYTPRHLTRVLTEELGAGPLALARAHRAQTARVLLTGTTLPITDVAFASGFGSVRQFNDTIGAVYELTPSGLRARGRSRSSADRTSDGMTITLRLPARAPFDGAGVLAFLGSHAVPGVESWDGVTYSRSLRLPSGSAVIALRMAADAPAPAVSCEASLSSLADLMPLVGRVRRLLDLDADAEAIDSALSADPALAASIATTPGTRVTGSVDPHETLFRVLVGQQVSVAAARTALGRLTAEIGEAGAGSHGDWMLFPTAAIIADRGAEVLRGPATRIATILDVARRLRSGALRVDVGMSTDELSAALLAVPGIGPWTAGYVAMSVLGSPDVLLTGDVAIRSGARTLGLPSDERGLGRHGRAWAPWRSYAGMHLWRAAIAQRR